MHTPPLKNTRAPLVAQEYHAPGRCQMAHNPEHPPSRLPGEGPSDVRLPIHVVRSRFAKSKTTVRYPRSFPGPAAAAVMLPLMEWGLWKKHRAAEALR